MAELCFIFPGQGAQKAGMGLELFEKLPEAKDFFVQADEILGRSLSTICFEGPDQELSKTSNSQPALLVTSLAALKAIEKVHSFTPAYYAGLSLGEYTALTAAGVINFEQALKIVAKRSSLMEQACLENKGGMASVISLSKDKIEEVISTLDGYMAIANLNCPGQIVISGDKELIPDACKKLKEAGAKLCVPLKVAGAFHSAHMQKAADEFKHFISDIDIKRENLSKVFSNVTGSPFTADVDFADSMARQITSSVLWENCMKSALNSGVDTFLEIGPGKTLSGMMKRIDRKAAMFNIETLSQAEELKL